MIPIDEHEIATDHMTKQCKNFIGNVNQPLFDGTDPDRVYSSFFGDTEYSDDSMLTYGEYIQYHKEVEVNEAYVETLDHYIGDKLVVPGKDYILVLDRVNSGSGMP